MKYTVLILLLFSTINSYSQKFTRFYDHSWTPVEEAKASYVSLLEKKDSVWHQQDFYRNTASLQMDGYYKDTGDKIAHGPFKYFYANKKLEMTGSYVNNKRDGLWLTFHRNGMLADSVTYVAGNVVGTRLKWYSNGYLSDSSVWNLDGTAVEVTWFDNGALSSAGRYLNGKENGKWKYFHKNGNPSAIEVYNEGKLVSREYFDEEGKQMQDTTNRDRDASFPGGNEGWKKFLEKNLYFPQNLEIVNADQINEMVLVAVDEEGKLSEIEVTVPVHPDFDVIATNVMKRSPKWLPAISHNRKIKQYHIQPITIVQEK